MATNYTPTEMLACVAARVLSNGKSVFVGTGLPMIAAMLAQRTTAPDLLIIFEAGGIGPRIPVLPVSVGDSRTFHQAVAASSMHDVMSLAQAGHVDYGFLGAAQIDRFGNVNTTVIGNYDHPKARLPGSGGANDLGSFCHQTIVVIRQDVRKFVKKLDFITTPGYLTGPGARERAGLPANSGPYRVVTQLAMYGFDKATCEMELIAPHPGVTTEQVQAESGFPIKVAEHVSVSEPPSSEERRLLREIDPKGLVIGG
ncbi:MAG: 3-oxoacid CoA-transferase [Chloroflexi bacterium]|jgi:acyl CoA:acetate/3-ketoacid CoA transferase beta subunit|nr:3-oxoacid CoA-transferase [Chloroflexota bacterium]